MGSHVSTRRGVQLFVRASDRVLRLFLSFALVFSYVQLRQFLEPTPVAASPAALSVSASVSAKPLLGGQATVHITVTNTDTTDKAYNVSLSDVISSSRPASSSPQAVATFVSASDGSGNLAPTSVSTTPTTGDTTVRFIDIRDLAPGESFSMDLLLDISGDPKWQVGDFITNAISVGANTIPNQTIPDITPPVVSANGKVVPIIIESKVAHQSTGVEQATGTGAGRRYHYTIDVQNNYVGDTDSVVVTDTIPDGVEYLGPRGASPAPDSVSRDASTGVTTLVWNLGTMATSASRQLAYDAGIRYDYYGTDNGGVNRSDATTLTTATAGTPILTSGGVKKQFTNHVELEGSWLSNPATDTAQTNVTGAALTISKGGTPGSGGLGTVIDYTLTYATSQYYSAVATQGLVLVHDHLPDGQIFETATANPAPSSIQHNSDGSTDITWTVGAVANTSGGAITFKATVGEEWQQPAYRLDPIVSGDSMTNTADIHGICLDEVDTARPLLDTTTNVSAGFSTSLPTIEKYMSDPKTGTLAKDLTMSIGDTSTVVVRFNTDDGVTPLKTDINMGNISLTDWLPVGMALVPGSVEVTYSAASDFTLPTTGTPPPLNIGSTPTTQAVADITGLSWYLGNVSPQGWWQATFEIVIVDTPEISDGEIVANLWKLTGVNTFGTPYSQRDQAMVTYAAPLLELDKSVTPPSPLVGGSAVPYTIAIDNTGGGDAQQVSIVDTLPVGMRATAPTVDGVQLGATTLVDGVDYVASWNGATGELAVSLQSGPALTPLPAGESLTIDYTAFVDAGQPAGVSLPNTATVSYSTRATPDGHVTPGTSDVADINTDDASVALDGCAIAKNGPAGPMRIGERHTYDLDVTVPARTVAYWPSVTDSLNREGFIATGTPTITTLSGAPLTAAAFENTATAPVRSTPASGSTLFTFDLADPIDNSNSGADYTFRLSFDVLYTGARGAGSWEFAPPTTTQSANDTARVAWNTVHAAVRSTNSNANSNVVATSFQQPLLTTVKSVVTTVTPGPFVGGQDILYRVRVTNTGAARAYGVSFVDTMPAASSSATLTLALLSGVGDVKPNASLTSTTTVLRGAFDSSVSIGTTQTLILEYRVTLAPNVGAGVTLTNTADMNWASLPGAPAGSRSYVDGPYENWTADTSSFTTAAAPATITKRTSTAGPIRIGDTVTYSIDCTVPANTVMWWPAISDRMDKRGVTYVSESATITTRANPPSVPATFSVTSTPTITLTGGNSTTYAWTLADPIDNSGNPLPYAFTLSFSVRYNGLNGAAWEMWPAGTTSPGHSLIDTASLAWRDVSAGGPTPNHTVASNSVSTTVRQPLIRTVKSIVTTVTPPPYVGGSPIRYRITLTNPGYNTAYDIVTTDTFPAEVQSAVLATATESGVGSLMSSATVVTSLPTSTVTFDQSVSMGTTQTIILEYDCVLAPTVGAGATLTNRADANWSSQPGTVTGERVYNDSAQEGATWVQDTTSVATTTPPATFSKQISGATTGTIGSAVVYSLDTTVPANETAYSLVVTDTVPDYLTVVAANASLPGTVTVGTPGPSGTLVTYSGGDVSGGASVATLSVTLLCQVRDVRYSGTQTPSGAFNNSALLAWRTRSSGGTTLTASGGPVAFTVMQPNLTITKAVTPATAGPGDTVTYTSVVTNTGNSPAHELRWGDTASALLTTPTLVAVKPSGMATLTAGVDFTTASTATSLGVIFDQPSSPAIDPGQTVTFTWTSTAVAGIHNGASMPDTATITSYTSVPGSPAARTYGSVNATRSVTALSPALVTSKSVLGGANAAYPLRGDSVRFRYTVRNVGTAPATAVTATDTLPADLSYVAGTSSATWPSGSSASDPAGGTGPTLTWAPGVTLQPGQTLTVDFDALVSSGAATGTVINTITASATDLLGAPVPANCASWVTSDTDALDRATAPIRIVQPGIALTKVLATGGDTHVQVGQLTGFRVSVVNTGDTTLTPTAVTDTFDPTVLQYVSASVAPSSTAAGTITWNSFGTIAPGATRSVNVTFTVLAQPASKLATNYASVVATDQFSHPVPGTQDTATVNVTRPRVSVSKALHAGQDTIIQVGEHVAFDLTVTNSGDQTLTTVPLADTYNSAHLTYVGASVTESATGVGSVSWANVASLGTNGVLAPGASVTIVATFTAASVPAGKTTNDTATINGALVRDINNDSTPSTSSVSSIAISAPSVTVVKTRATGQDPQIQVGQTVTYRLAVTNSGDTTLATIPLTDAWDAAALGSPVSAPAGAFAPGSGSWTLGPLSPGASTVVTLTLTALAVPAGQVTTDTATVSGTDVNGDPAPGNDSSESVRITRPAVAIVKSRHAGQDPQVQVGQTVQFDIAVTNTGDTTLTTVPLADTFDAAALTYTTATVAPSGSGAGTLTWNNVGPLAVGQAATVTVSFTAAAVPLGQVTTDTAAVSSATDVYGDHPADANATADVTITHPAVAVTKSLHAGQDPQIQLGETVTYDITVTNTGDTTLDTLTVGDAWDGAFLAFDNASPAAASGSAGATWTIGPLAPAASQTLQLTLQATGWPPSLATTDVASAVATDTYGDPATSTPSAASVSITHPDIAVAKSLAVGQDPEIQVGQQVTFDLRVTNTGNVALASVPVTDTFDAAALAFTTATVAPSSVGAGTLGWSNVGPIAVGQTVIIPVTFTALAVPAGQLTVDSLSTSGGTDTFGDPVPSASATAAVRITAPALSITKALHAGQDTAVQEGDPVAFDITIANTGDTTLTTVPLTDTYDASRLDFTSAAPSQSTTSAGSIGWANVGPLSPGDSATVVTTFSAVWNGAGQLATNTATTPRATDEYGDHTTTQTASASLKVTRPGLELTKTRVTDGAIQSSQTVTFDLTVTNTGDTTLTTVPLTDTWDDAYLLFSSSAPVTVAGSGFASWDVAPIAPGDSATVNLTLVALQPVPGLTTIDTATVVGALDENDDPANDDIATDSVDITKPGVAIDKVRHAGQDAQVQVGDTVTFDLGVTNTGDTTLTTVPLSDTFDPAVFAFDSASTAPDSNTGGSVSWNNIGPISAGQTTTVTVTLEAIATSGGGSSVDTATVSGATDSNGDPAPDASDEATARVTAPSLSISKTPAPGQDPQVQVGQSVQYRLTFTNTGDTTLTSVPMRDDWDASVLTGNWCTGSAVFGPGWVTWANVGPLAPGQSRVYQLGLTAVAPAPGLVTSDTAAISGTDEFGDPAAETSSSASVMVTRPDVTLSKSRHAGQDTEIQVGETVAYDLVVTNSGDTTLATVPLSDTFDDAALTFTTATVAPDSTGAGSLAWNNVGPLAQGESTTVTVTFTAAAVPAGQVTTDTANVTNVRDTYDDPAPDRASDADIRITAPDVAIDKVLHAGQDTAVQAGQTVTYDITVTNTGDTTLVTVPVSDTYDETVLAFTSATPAIDSTSINEVGWSNVGPLDPGESTTIVATFTAIVNPAGQVTTDTATAHDVIDEYGDSPADASDDADVKVTVPSLTLDKSPAAGQDPYIQAGQTATFDLTVTNTGDTTLTSVPLADTWDDTLLTYTSSDWPLAAQSGGSASWDIAPIGPGASVTVRLVLTATGAYAPHTLTDTATVTGALDENADPAADATDTATIDLTHGEVDVVKSLADGQDPVVQVGQPVSYDIAVTNIGDVDLTTVPLSDAFDSAVFGYSASSIAPSSTAPGLVSWGDIGPLAVGQTTTVTVTMIAVGTSDVSASIDTATVAGAIDINDDPAIGDHDTAGAMVTRPAVEIDKVLASGQAANVPLGALVTYDLVVTNSGDTTLATVPLADTFDPAQLELVSTSFQPTDAPAPGVVSWPNVAAPLGIAPGDSVRVPVTFRAIAAGPSRTDTATIVGAVDVFGDQPPNVTDTNADLGVFDPGMFVISKSADPTAGTIMLPGQRITYTLTWDNTQQVDIPDVVITDVLPDSVDYVAGSLMLGLGSQTDAADADAGSFDEASSTVRFDLGTVSAMTSGSATFQVVVAPEERSAAGVMNSALYTSSDSTLGVAGPVFHPVDPFTIEKRGRDINGGRLKGGDIIEWTITVTNIGLTSTTHVVVTDNVPSTTTYVKNSIRGRGANDSKQPRLRWDIGEMAVGEVQVLKFRSRVKKGLPTGTKIRNQAVVSSDQSLPKKSDNPKTSTSGDPTILVAKTSGSEGWRIPLGIALILLVAGFWVWPRRRRLAMATAQRDISDRKAGGRNA